MPGHRFENKQPYPTRSDASTAAPEAAAKPSYRFTVSGGSNKAEVVIDGRLKAALDAIVGDGFDSEEYLDKYLTQLAMIRKGVRECGHSRDELVVARNLCCEYFPPIDFKVLESLFCLNSAELDDKKYRSFDKVDTRAVSDAALYLEVHPYGPAGHFSATMYARLHAELKRTYNSFEMGANPVPFILVKYPNGSQLGEGKVCSVSYEEDDDASGRLVIEIPPANLEIYRAGGERAAELAGKLANALHLALRGLGKKYIGPKCVSDGNALAPVASSLPTIMKFFKRKGVSES